MFHNRHKVQRGGFVTVTLCTGRVTLLDVHKQGGERTAFCALSFACSLDSAGLFTRRISRLGACILEGRPRSDKKAREDDGSHRGVVCCVER
jgi:hypothetical protein